MTTNTVDPAQPTPSTVVVATDGSVTVTQVSNATTVTYPGVFGTPFSPLDLSPTLWLDASDATTITESGGAVSQWDDKSGNGYDLTQGTGTLQPTTGTRTINGLNVLDFTDDLLSNSNVSASMPVTIFAVAQSDASAGLNPYLISDGGPGVVVSYLTTTSYRLYQGSNLSGGVKDENPNIWRVIFDTTDTLHINSAQILSGSAGGNEWATGFYLGSNTVGTVGWNGTIAEVIFVDGTLTAQQIADTETYLADKWGITLP